MCIDLISNNFRSYAFHREPVATSMDSALVIIAFEEPMFVDTSST